MSKSVIARSLSFSASLMRVSLKAIIEIKIRWQIHIIMCHYHRSFSRNLHRKSKSVAGCPSINGVLPNAITENSHQQHDPCHSVPLESYQKVIITENQNLRQDPHHCVLLSAELALSESHHMKSISVTSSPLLCATIIAAQLKIITKNPNQQYDSHHSVPLP